MTFSCFVSDLFRAANLHIMPPKQDKQTKKTTVSEMSVDDLQMIISQAINSALKPLNDSMANLQKEVSSLKETVKNLSDELAKKDEKIEMLEAVVADGLDEREQYSRRNNLRIFGIPEAENEDTDKLVIDVAGKMGVSLEPYHIDRSHRVGKTSENPRPIIVKFVSYAERRVVFTSKKKLKGSRITVREDLTKTRLDLLKTAESQYSRSAVWTSDGVILVNVGKQRPFRVKTGKDLEKLLKKFPPS